jgi:hypothetical protein
LGVLMCAEFSLVSDVVSAFATLTEQSYSKTLVQTRIGRFFASPKSSVPGDVVGLFGEVASFYRSVYVHVKQEDITALHRDTVTDSTESAVLYLFSIAFDAPTISRTG